LVIKKTKIVFEFDEGSLKELRKILFKKGLSPQQFFTYVIEKVTLYDHRLLEIMDETVTYKQHNFGNKRKSDIDAELVYKLIEKNLKEKNKNGV